MSTTRFHDAIKGRQPSQSQADRTKEQIGVQPAIADALSLPLVGSVTLWAGAEAPDDDRFLLCDFSTPFISDYPELYAAIGDTWNDGNEPDGTFRLPNSPGRAIVGAGQGAGLTNRNPADEFGEEEVALDDVTYLPPHNHTGATGNAGSHDHTTYANRATGNTTTGGSADRLTILNTPAEGGNQGKTDTQAAHAHTIPQIGDATPHPNTQPSIAFHLIIRAKL